MTWGSHKVDSVRMTGDAKGRDQLMPMRTGLPSGGIGTGGRKRPRGTPCNWVKSNGQAARGSFAEKALGPGGKPAEQDQGGWKYEGRQTVEPGLKELVLSPSLEGFQLMPDKSLINLV